jgi:trigger factor
MQVDKKEHSSLSRTYTITIPLSEIDEKVNEWIVKKAATVKMDGFRKGKVPLDVVRKHYLDQAKPSVLEDMVKSAQKDIIEKDQLNLLSDPSFQIKSGGPEEDFVVDMSVETSPNIELKDHKDIHIEKIVCEVTQEEFEEAYKVFCNNFKALSTTNEPVKIRNVVSLSYETFLGKTRLNKYCSEKVSIDIGTTENFLDTAIGKIAEGMCIGEEKQGTLTFPKDFKNKELRAKCADVRVKILNVQSFQHSELTDETAKLNSFGSVEDVKNFIWKKLRALRKKQIDICNKRAILDALSEAYTFEVPQSFVETDFKDTWKNVEKDLKKARVEDDEDVRGKTDEDIMQEFRDVSQRRIRIGLLLMEIFRSEKRELPPEFIEEWLNQKYLHSEFLLYLSKTLLPRSRELRDRLAPAMVEDFATLQAINSVSSTERVLTPEELLALVQDTVSDDDLSEYDWRTMDIFSSTDEDDSSDKNLTGTNVVEGEVVQSPEP